MNEKEIKNSIENCDHIKTSIFNENIEENEI